MWDLPRPGLEPMSPASAGRFLTAAPRGKSPNGFLGPCDLPMNSIPSLFFHQPLSRTWCSRFQTDLFPDARVLLSVAFPAAQNPLSFLLFSWSAPFILRPQLGCLLLEASVSGPPYGCLHVPVLTRCPGCFHGLRSPPGSEL